MKTLKYCICLLLAIALISSCSTPSERIIKYTTNDNFKIEFKDNKFGDATLVSNEYSEDEQCFYATFDKAVETFGAECFKECETITSVTIPNGVTSIGEYAFFYCSSLTSIKIPTSVTCIGESAFYGCTGLKNLKIPDSVTTIGRGAFSNCSGLTRVVVAADNTIYDNRGDCNAIIETETNTLVAGCKNSVIPNSVTSIGDDAFSGCTGLTSVKIPTSVTKIGYGAFRDCTGLKSVDIPPRVTSIGEYAFHGCTGLKSMKIPYSVSANVIGYNAIPYHIRIIRK